MSKRINRSMVGGLLVVALLAAGGIATIASADLLPEADQDHAVIEFEFLEDEGLLVYWLPGDGEVDDDGNPVDCVSLVTAADAGDADVPEGCHVVEVAGPNGQVNHGTVVSSFVHSIKDLEYDGPRGHLVREIAKSGIGKDDVTDLDEDDESGVDDDDGDDDGPKKDKKEKKEKKPKRDGHPGRGNGRS